MQKVSENPDILCSQKYQRTPHTMTLPGCKAASGTSLGTAALDRQQTCAASTSMGLVWPELAESGMAARECAAATGRRSFAGFPAAGVPILNTKKPRLPLTLPDGRYCR